ncbi:hypothetical protein RB195_018780 [Necator americanus]|uniref:Uncharacterized protein n=1 Tax=Necator americanus TaxID=51031 RepID=A0ABR1CCH3_NECAM
MSAINRQQIGIVKRQIRKTLGELQREDFKLTQLQTLTDNELLNVYESHTSAHGSLFRVYFRINRWWTNWQKLMESHPEEEGILHTNISKYGDFRELINDAVFTLQKLDNERPQIETELQRRQLQFEPYTESDADSLQSSEPSSTFPIPQPTAVSSVQVHPPIQHVEPSNLSFVDASILSKLDLPVFEGNLLDFPEFWQRFSTVVGDKPQLDDATKFSLLKSTLRGCALQTIKGLSVTSANYSVAVEILKNHFDDHVTTRNILYTRTSLSSTL